MTQTKKVISRQRRKQRIRKKIFGTELKPRLSIYKSNVAIYAQLIDDTKGVTLVAASSIKEKKSNIEAAKKVGAELAKKAKDKKITSCVFDRNGLSFHGGVEAFAEEARKEIKF